MIPLSRSRNGSKRNDRDGSDNQKLIKIKNSSNIINRYIKLIRG